MVLAVGWAARSSSTSLTRREFHSLVDPFAAESNKKIPGKQISGTVKFLACCFQPRKGQAMRLN